MAIGTLLTPINPASFMAPAFENLIPDIWQNHYELNDEHESYFDMHEGQGYYSNFKYLDEFRILNSKTIQHIQDNSELADQLNIAVNYYEELREHVGRHKDKHQLTLFANSLIAEFKLREPDANKFKFPGYERPEFENAGSFLSKLFHGEINIVSDAAETSASVFANTHKNSVINTWISKILNTFDASAEATSAHTDTPFALGALLLSTGTLLNAAGITPENIKNYAAQRETSAWIALAILGQNVLSIIHASADLIEESKQVLNVAFACNDFETYLSKLDKWNKDEIFPKVASDEAILDISKKKQILLDSASNSRSPEK